MMRGIYINAYIYSYKYMHIYVYIRVYVYAYQLHQISAVNKRVWITNLTRLCHDIFPGNLRNPRRPPREEIKFCISKLKLFEPNSLQYFSYIVPKFLYFTHDLPECFCTSELKLFEFFPQFTCKTCKHWKYIRKILEGIQIEPFSFLNSSSCFLAPPLE